MVTMFFLQKKDPANISGSLANFSLEGKLYFNSHSNKLSISFILGAGWNDTRSGISWIREISESFRFIEETIRFYFVRPIHSTRLIDAINYANYTNEEESRSKSNREINIARRAKISFRGILI